MAHLRIALIIMAGCLASATVQAQSVSREQAIDVATKDLDLGSYSLDAVLHTPYEAWKIPTAYFEPGCLPEHSMLGLHNLTVWQVDAKLKLRPGVRGWNLRYFVDAISGNVVARCRL